MNEQPHPLPDLIHRQHGDPALRETTCGASVDADQVTRDWARVTCPECSEWVL